MEPGDIFRRMFGFLRPSFPTIEEREQNIHPETKEERYLQDDPVSFIEEFASRQIAEFQKAIQEFATIHTPAGSAVLLHEKENNPREEMLKERSGSLFPPASIPKASPPTQDSQLNQIFADLFSPDNFGYREKETRVDSDIDAEVDRQGLGKLLESSPSSSRPHQGSILTEEWSSPGFNGRWAYSSTVITSSTNQNGRVEQRQIVKDSEGNEETTVLTLDGDTCHVVTTKKNSTGEKEETCSSHPRDFNLAEQWNDEHDQKQSLSPMLKIPNVSLKDHESSIFKRLFGFSFSSTER